MTNEPREPDSWRDWVKADYEYPDDWDDLSRRQRRRARKNWRREDHSQRMDWLRDKRQAEPASPGGVVIAIVFLAIVLVGFGAALPRLLHGDRPQRPSVGLLTPAPVASDPVSTAGTPSGSQSSTRPEPSSSPALPTSSAQSSLPVAVDRVTAADIAQANKVVANWAHVFYTRNPAAESYSQLVVKAGRYTTAAVTDSFTGAGDSTYGALKAAHGTSKVLAAPVSDPRPGTAPVDTPGRITRLVSIKVRVTGAKPAQLSLPLMITLVPQGSTWVISDVNGGAGT